MILTTENHNGRTYYNTEARGTEYTLSLSDYGWELWSQRKALSYNPQLRRFDSLEQVESALKCFRGISQLIGEAA